ncbi:MAG: phosphate acyltransferase [Bilophila wadsworthia]
MFERCLEKCRARKGAVVYSDGEDRRVVSAAAKLIREGLVEPILIGDPEKVRAALQESGETGVSLQVVNPYNPALLQHNAAEYMSIQKDKGKDISEERLSGPSRTPPPSVPLWSAAVKPKSARWKPVPTADVIPPAAWSAPPLKARPCRFLQGGRTTTFVCSPIRGHSGTHFRAASDIAISTAGVLQTSRATRPVWPCFLHEGQRQAWRVDRGGS